MNTASLPGMTLSLFCGCEMILGGSTAEKRKGGVGGGEELRQVLFGSFEGKIALYRGRRKDYKTELEKRYIILCCAEW